MEVELQGTPTPSSNSGSSGSHVVISIIGEELPWRNRFLSTSTSVDYNAYRKLRPPEEAKAVNKDIMSSLQNQVDEHHKSRSRTKSKYSAERMFLVASIGLETVSAVFDQLSDLSHPHYALIGMVSATFAVSICIWELIHKGYCKKERVLELMSRWGLLKGLFSNFADFCGLLFAIAQCVCSAVQYYSLHRHAANPIKLSIYPFIFLVALAISRCTVNEI